MQSEPGADRLLSRYATPPDGRRVANRRLSVAGGLRFPVAPRHGRPRTRARGLVRLTLSDTALRLAPMLRLRWISPDWTIPYRDVAVAQPVRGLVGGGGVRLTVAGTRIVFLCSAPTDVLRVLEDRGVPVDWEWETVEWASLGEQQQ